MPGSEASRFKLFHVFGIGSLILGLLALASALAYEVACADLGSDLGIASRGFRALFRLSTIALAGFGIALAIPAAATAPTWPSRLGASLPGLLSSAAAIVCFVLES